MDKSWLFVNRPSLCVCTSWGGLLFFSGIRFRRVELEQILAFSSKHRSLFAGCRNDSRQVFDGE